MKNIKSISSLIAVLLGIVLVSIVGYVVFLKYMTVFIPSIESYSLFLIAIIAGIAAFFNPCNFIVLPAYLSYYYQVTEKKTHNQDNKIKKILLYGVIAALGVVTFNLILGSFIGLLGAGFGKSFALAGNTPNLFVRVFRGAIGSILIILGILHISGVSFQINFINKMTQSSISEQKNPYIGLFVFGFMYTAIGIGCGGPILAGLSVFAFGAGGFYSALFAFLLFSITMALLMITISLLVGFSKGTILTKLRSSTVAIKKFSGVILILVGILLLLSSIYTQQFVGLLFPI